MESLQHNPLATSYLATLAYDGDRDASYPQAPSVRFLMISHHTGTVATVEKHNKKCGGDPDLAPRMFSLEVDLKTGAARWDNNPEMEMRPIPGK